jgi:glycosyltransferase involved in cell wall biosynthesis
MNENPLLTIAIPTFNRSLYLERTLSQLQKELAKYGIDSIEVIVSDNASKDNTEQVVTSLIQQGLPVKYVKNSDNIGSDANIAQAFNLATGQYVLILGDDDLFVDGALKKAIDILQQDNYGVVFLRSFGFDENFNQEKPVIHSQPIIYDNVGKFIVRLGAQITLISACIINKSNILQTDASVFCGSNLVQVNLVLKAALSAPKNVYTKEYYIACKRNNSGGYNMAQVFAQNLGKILDEYLCAQDGRKVIASFERGMIFKYFPQYLLKSLLKNMDIHSFEKPLNSRYEKYLSYRFCLAPSFYLPRMLAIAWLLIITTLGRVANGDALRGLVFVRTKIVILLKNIFNH